MVFLMETKSHKNKMEKLRTKLGFPNMFVVDCVRKSGGLALLWEDGGDVEIQNFSQRHIQVIIHNCLLHVEWKFTTFYGYPDATKRIEAWSLLKHLANIGPVPWVCVGDFNEVLSLTEKCGGNSRQEHLMQAFQETLDDCALTDMGYFGPKFTWSNCQEEDALIKERLDREVANLEWRNYYPNAEVEVGVAVNSDHAPLFLNLLGTMGATRRRKRFHFEACWALDEGCKEVIQRS